MKPVRLEPAALQSRHKVIGKWYSFKVKKRFLPGDEPFQHPLTTDVSACQLGSLGYQF